MKRKKFKKIGFEPAWLNLDQHQKLKDLLPMGASLQPLPGVVENLRMTKSPAEVENRLLAHEAVAQAVVVAAPDTDGLDKPVAFVVLRPGRPAGEDELIEFCREGMESFKRPRKVVFVDAYPTTATGKIRRVELRARAATLLLEPAASPTA